MTMEAVVIRYQLPDDPPPEKLPPPPEKLLEELDEPDQPLPEDEIHPPPDEELPLPNLRTIFRPFSVERRSVRRTGTPTR
jgi:hypothetical protein